MVHVRINERESRPNEYINWITALPMPGATPPFSEEDARQLLRALAAQMKPIMKKYGMTVNSFVEYENNLVFLGRNWNHGETVELVLRNADGSFMPVGPLLGTLCHELAHIHHMNHGPAFQKLWSKLRGDVWDLQSKGYFGDGYWSGGSRLIDSQAVSGDGVEAHFDVPEYICGGAQSGSRPKGLKRRRVRRNFAGPSTLTGAQTEKKRKAGSRITAPDKFIGEGKALNNDITDETVKAKGIGFRKQANSKKAREERALAAEKRLLTLQGKSQGTKTQTSDSEESDSSSDVEFLGIFETDADRRKLVGDASSKDDQSDMRRFMDEWRRPQGGKGKGKDPEETPGLPYVQVETVQASSSHVSKTTKAKPKEIPALPFVDTAKTEKAPKSSLLKSMVQNEIVAQKRASLGLNQSKKLGSKPKDSKSSSRHIDLTKATNLEDAIKASQNDSLELDDAGWTCQVCTLRNLPLHLVCAVCNSERGECPPK